MAAPLVPKLLRAHLSDLASNDARLDDRGQWDGRETKLEVGILPRAEGFARVIMGNIIVFVGVKF